MARKTFYFYIESIFIISLLLFRCTGCPIKLLKIWKQTQVLKSWASFQNTRKKSLSGTLYNFIKKLSLLICTSSYKTSSFGLKTKLFSGYSLMNKLIPSRLVSRITNVMNTTQIVLCIAWKITILGNWGAYCLGH